MKLNLNANMIATIHTALLAHSPTHAQEFEALTIDGQLAALDEQRARLVAARNERRAAQPTPAPKGEKSNRFAELNAQRKAAKEARKAAWQAEQAAKATEKSATIGDSVREEAAAA